VRTNEERKGELGAIGVTPCIRGKGNVVSGAVHNPEKKTNVIKSGK
jgi:hypothetical protein